MVFPVITYRWERGPQRGLIAKELMLLNGGAGGDSGVPQMSGRSDRSVLKKVGLECSLEGLMLGLKFQFFSHVVRGACSLENTDDGKD